jgi:hypothetical protein
VLITQINIVYRKFKAPKVSESSPYGLGYKPLAVGVLNFMESEIWKDIPGYEGYYQASNFGKIKSLDRHVYNPRKKPKFCKGKILNTCVNEYGYSIITLYKFGKIKFFQVHQLVAMAFLNHSPCGYKMIVDHIDFNKANNNAENLRIVSQRENTSHSPRRKKPTSKYVGVHFKTSRKLWQSSITINRVNIWLGEFEIEKEASEVYQKAVLNADKFNGNIKEFKNLIKNK